MRKFTKIERRCFQLLDNLLFKQIPNTIPRARHGETKEHFLKKCEVFFNTPEDEIIFCEALLINGYRPDLFNISTATVFEIRKSENDNSIGNKKKVYNNLGLNFEVIDA